ncbi:NAD(P)/FAD-dependent oxidoreductase [Devosia psychrophila]|uniref:Amino acid dehydrogenase n=1 Tax=Devosia psychrophila TaxID=728005 RepID=A0A0F5Q0J7_9HYPH|nr:FAD-dependent oxidoreductase [Devosia psychrophila]KKC34400.1 amino acid dehydrogenase [Devosia psychrophila]SFD43436.1 D-amino-acid dehydrogenase [Devosia psychrophila]
MKVDALVLGAGIVGVSVAIHLAMRGRSVVLVDRRGAGEETSFGNAGLIQREGVAPHLFPQDLPTLLSYARNQSTTMRFQWRALPKLSNFLLQYWWYSRSASYQKIVDDYSKFIAHAVSEHAPLVEQAGASNLIGKAGWMEVYRSKASFNAAQTEAEAHSRFGLEHEVLDPSRLKSQEPGVTAELAGGIHWTQPWTVRDPLALTQAYLRLFQKLGGRFAISDATTLREVASGWEVDTIDGAVTARDAVVALGPWSDKLLRKLGRRLPLGVKRGYHMHYGPRGNIGISMPIYDEAGFLVAPMHRGIRLTTGAEFALLDAPSNPAQLNSAEQVAALSYPLGERLDTNAWLGARPCTPDMKPIVGPEGRQGLWLALGHAHHGLTLGPATGRLLAEMMTGETPFIDPTPYSISRFN